MSNGDKSRRGSNASRDRSDSRDNQRSRSKDKGAVAAAAGKNKRSSSRDSKAASRESTASNGRSIEKGRTGLTLGLAHYFQQSITVILFPKFCLGFVQKEMI